ETRRKGVARPAGEVVSIPFEVVSIPFIAGEPQESGVSHVKTQVAEAGRRYTQGWPDPGLRLQQPGRRGQCAGTSTLAAQPIWRNLTVRAGASPGCPRRQGARTSDHPPRVPHRFAA